MDNNITWDQFYMSLAHLAAMKSKDPSTRTGCVIVNQYNRVVSFGLNGFPSGVNDDVPERYVRPTKYLYTEHSERNAIYNSETDLTGCKLYVTWYPCCDCARAIIQKRIAEVIIHKEFNEFDNMDGRWDDSHAAAKTMFEEAGVKVRFWSGNVIQIKGLKNGKEVDLHNLV